MSHNYINEFNGNSSSSTLIWFKIYSIMCAAALLQSYKFIIIIVVIYITSSFPDINNRLNVLCDYKRLLMMMNAGRRLWYSDTYNWMQIIFIFRMIYENFQIKFSHRRCDIAEHLMRIDKTERKKNLMETQKLKSDISDMS